MATGFKFIERSGAGVLSRLPQEMREQIERNAEEARARLEARRRHGQGAADIEDDVRR